MLRMDFIAYASMKTIKTKSHIIYKTIKNILRIHNPQKKHRYLMYSEGILVRS